MADRSFVRRVNQGDIVQVSGTAERYGAEATGLVTRHHWSASCQADATCLIAEVWTTNSPVSSRQLCKKSRHFNKLLLCTQRVPWGLSPKLTLLCTNETKQRFLA